MSLNIGNPKFRILARRLVRGQTRFGIFGNIWPTSLSRRDRATIGVWYVDMHAFGLYITVTGVTR